MEGGNLITPDMKKKGWRAVGIDMQVKKKSLGGAGRAAAEWTLKARILPFKAVLNNYCFRRNSFPSSSR